MAAVALLGLVAVGALRGPLGSGRGRPHYPADLVDSLLLLLLLAMLAAGVLAMWTLWPDRHLLRQRRRRGGSFSLILPMAAVLALWLLRDVLGLGSNQDDPTASTLAPPSTVEGPASPAQSGVVPLIVAGAALATMVGLVVAQLVAERRRRRPPSTPAERLVELLDDTLDDLEGEPDPRRAVIAAWARMERGLAAAGLPRHPAEAPFEYATRVLEAAVAPSGLPGPLPTHRGTPPGFPGPLPTHRGTPPGFPGPLRRSSVHRLTGLFERAKFSHHPVGEADREEAIAALRTVRRELADAAEAAAGAGPGGQPVAGGGWGR
jgi:hypothetical protein